MGNYSQNKQISPKSYDRLRKETLIYQKRKETIINIRKETMRKETIMRMRGDTVI